MKPCRIVALLGAVIFAALGFSLPGCSSGGGAPAPTPIVTPVPTPTPPAVNDTPTVSLTMPDGLAAGDITTFLPAGMVAVSEQFRAKYTALFAQYPVPAGQRPLPVPDWDSAKQADGTYLLGVDFVNDYRALSENLASR